MTTNSVSTRRPVSSRTGPLVRALLPLALAMVAGLLIVGAPARLHAQSEASRPAHSNQTSADTGAEPDEHFFSDAHRRELYEQGRLRFSKAALLNLALPGLGNFYARQFFLGGTALTLMAFAAVFVGFGAVYSDPTYVWLGVGVLGVTYPGSIATSYFGVRKYNRELRESLRIDEARSGSLGRDIQDHRFMRHVPKFRGVNINIRF